MKPIEQLSEILSEAAGRYVEIMPRQADLKRSLPELERILRLDPNKRVNACWNWVKRYCQDE